MEARSSNAETRSLKMEKQVHLAQETTNDDIKTLEMGGQEVTTHQDLQNTFAGLSEVRTAPAPAQNDSFASMYHSLSKRRHTTRRSVHPGARCGCRDGRQLVFFPRLILPAQAFGLVVSPVFFSQCGSYGLFHRFLALERCATSISWSVVPWQQQALAVSSSQYHLEQPCTYFL